MTDWNQSRLASATSTTGTSRTRSATFRRRPRAAAPSTSTRRRRRRRCEGVRRAQTSGAGSRIGTVPSKRSLVALLRSKSGNLPSTTPARECTFSTFQIATPLVSKSLSRPLFHISSYFLISSVQYFTRALTVAMLQLLLSLPSVPDDPYTVVGQHIHPLRDFGTPQVTGSTSLAPTPFPTLYRCSNSSVYPLHLDPNGRIKER